jgi:hypothetical protein
MKKIQNIAIFRLEKSLLSILTCCHLVLYLFGDPHVSLLPSFPKTGKKIHPRAQTNMKSLERVVHAPPFRVVVGSLFGAMNPF